MILIQLLLSLTLFTAHAVDESPNNDPNESAKNALTEGLGATSCQGALTDRPLSRHRMTFITSGRETPKSRKQHEDAIDELFGPEGVLTRLGITTDRETVIHFMRGPDMAAGTANGRYPVTHVMEGAQLMARRGGGLIYETAIPGKNVQHSIYRDDNPFLDQYSIMIHVAGHNHFTFHTKYSQQREFDLNREALALDKLLQNAYLANDREEVTLWYQYLESLGNAQDIIDGLHKKPEDFAPDLTRTSKRGLFPNDPVDDMRHPRQPTRSVLQAFLGNLPADIAPWKREIALQFEKLIRWQTSILNTKIINEGFATFLMRMVPKHTSKNTFEDTNAFANLEYGVTYPRIENPYYIGVEGWTNIYERFKSQPEIEALKTEFEKDKAFIEYATKEIIPKMNDQDFLRFSLDEEWVRKKKLRLTRELDHSQDVDNNPNQPPPGHIRQPAKFIVLSDKTDVIVESLINRLARRERRIPQPILTDWNHLRTNTIRLEMNDPWANTRPLTNTSIVKTLFVFAQIEDKPVALESTHIVTEVIEPENNFDDDDMLFGMPGGFGGFNRWGWMPPEIKYHPTRVKVTVSPNGEVKAHKILWNGSSDPKNMPLNPFLSGTKEYKYEEVEMPELSAQLKKILDRFILSLKLTARSPAIDSIPPKLKFNMEDTTSQHSNQVSTGLFEHVPTAASAIAEYESYIQSRGEDLFNFAMNNNTIIRGNRTVSFRVLPEQPYFNYDNRLIQEMEDAKKPRPVDRRGAKARAAALKKSYAAPQDADPFPRTLQFIKGGELPSVTDPEGTVRPVDGKPGDSYWDENPRNQQGDNGEDGGPGDEGEEPGDGSEPGKDGNDPRYLKVPIEKYAKFLEDLIELPNLRPKKGVTKTQGAEYTSLRATQRGILAPDESYTQAYAMGFARFIADGKTKEEIKKMPAQAVIVHGLVIMQDPDFRARDEYPIPNPDINALVTVVVDLSGSMWGAIPVLRQMVFDMRVILMRRYKGIKFQFVSFDAEGHVFENFEDFIGTDLGGGTDYEVGMNKVKDDIYPKHPESEWDRFFMLAGDFADNPRRPGAFTDLLSWIMGESQYTSAVLFDMYNQGAGNELFDFFEQKSKSDDYVGFIKINPPDSYKPAMFRELFKNKEK